MAFRFVELKYCVLLGLIKVSVGQAVGQETGSDVSIVIDFQQYLTLCKELEIFFVRLAMEVNWQERILSFSDDGDKCLSVVSNEYVQRISKADINFPISVTFILRNVSFLDTGKYSARSKGKILGERILFVTDRTLGACTGNNEEFDIVLPLSPFNEELNVMFYNMLMPPLAVIRVADTAPPVCTTNVKYLQCKVNRYSLSVTIKTVNFLNQGIYALIGNRTGVVHGSAILFVIENGEEGCSTVLFTTHRMVDSSVVNSEPDCSKVTFTTQQMVTVTEVHEDTIDEAAVDQSFVIQKEYFIGGGIVAGIVLVTLACLFIHKRCRHGRGNVASDGSYENTDVHYNSSLSNQDQRVSDRVDSMRPFPESQRRRAVNIETNVYDEIGFDMVTETNFEATNPSETYYITPC